MSYKLYPKSEGEFLAKDFEVKNPSRIVLIVSDSDAGDDLCLKLDEPGIYDFIRDASLLHEAKSDASALKRVMPVLEKHLGESIKAIRAVGILDSDVDVWIHLDHRSEAE